MANGETSTVDYDALANQYGQINPNVDYDALARQHGAISSTPPSTPASPPSVVYQRTPGTADAKISAQPSTFENWLQNAGADVRYGGARTAVGRVLSALGAQGTDVGSQAGVPERTADIPIGAGKGALHTVYTGGDVIRQNLGMPRVVTDPQVQAAITPSNPTQRAGYTAEQIGEYYLPSTAAETALGRVGLSALGTGTISKAQGGKFTTGAALGGLGQAGSEALTALAPAAAESALGTRRFQRAYGKTPGQATIAETTGIAPETVAASADQQIQNLNGQLAAAARRAPGMGTVQPAIDVVDAEIADAIKHNNSAAMEPLQKLKDQLTTDTTTLIGRPLPINRPAEDILNAKRGIGDLINSWNPEARTAYAGVKKRIYNALDGQLDSLVPESEALNQRISSLIPVRDQARNQALAPGIVQSSWERFARPTGALIGGLEGARQGYSAYGIPGAVAGGTIGVIAPSIIASPEFRMGMARLMATNPAARQAVMRGGIGALLQFLP